MSDKNDQEWIVTPGLIDEVKRFENLYKIAKDLPIMICGPTGVGKSLFVHIYEKLYKEEYEKNAKKPVRLNCAAFTKELILSEIFGHVKGAFSGAYQAKKGHIEKADGGVLILEEIGVIPENGQEQLLTFIEDGYYFKVGSIQEKTANVRIIATTNKSKEDFREDFWYRFFPFYVPPLHQRRMDALYHLANKFPDITRKLMPQHILMLLCYNWPGNIRELERVARIVMWESINVESNITVYTRMAFMADHDLVLMKELTKKRRKLDSLGKTNSPWDWNISYFNPGYTSLISYGFSFNYLKDFGVNFDLLNSELEKDNLSLSSKSKKLPFKNIDKFEWNKEIEIEKRFGVSAYLPMELFKQIHLSFHRYCFFFLQTSFSDHNLINFREKFNPDHFLFWPHYLSRTDEVFRLRKKLFEFVTQTKLPVHIKSFPQSDSLERKELEFIVEDLKLKIKFPQVSNSDDELKITEKVVSYMSDAELQKMHNRVLLKRTGGNKTEAAKIKGMKPSTFQGRLDKFGS